MDKIRVLIADDHAMVREGLRMILEAHPDMEVVGEAATGQEAVALAQELEPDVVIMDLAMPGMGGLEAIRLLQERRPQVRVLALTMYDDPDHFFQALHAGASGYVVQGGSSADLVAAVRAVHEGGVYLYPTVAKALVSDYLRQMGPEEERASLEALSQRERQILQLIAEGKTAQEIADQLYLSINTVHTYRRRIMEKLGLHNRAQLIRYALRKGIIRQ